MRRNRTSDTRASTNKFHDSCQCEQISPAATQDSFFDCYPFVKKDDISVTDPC